MSKAGKIAGALLVGAALGLFDGGDEEVAQELYDEGYDPEEIADELGMDPEDVREIVGEDDDRDYGDYDY